MRIRTAVPSVLLALGLIIAAQAHAATVPGRISLRAWTGFTTLSLADINDDIRSNRAAFRADTLVEETHWDPFGGSANLRLEMDVQLTPMISAGLGFSSQNGSIRLQASRVFSTDPITGEPAEVETFERDPKYSAWDVVGTLGLWFPSAPGLNFGLQLGFVRGELVSEDTHLLDTFSSSPVLEISNGDWKGTGAVVGAFGGYERPILPELSLSTRMGYRYRNIARPDGILRTTSWGDQGNSREWTSGPLLDSKGKPMDLNLSGFYCEVGLTLGFGGGD
jgi:hypothetical protein